jgi:hypothetical protein
MTQVWMDWDKEEWRQDSGILENSIASEDS